MLPRARRFAAAACGIALAAACASTTVAREDRAVRDALEQATWRTAGASDVAGHWKLRSADGPVAAAVFDLAYWIDPSGAFSGAALLAHTPPRYEVLSGRWTLSADGTLQLGEDAAPAHAEIAEPWLRLSGDEGSLVLERAETR